MAGGQNPYDEFPYPGYPFAQTHPDRLATVATLFGMSPAPVEACRVLELGCGDGGNLIPMALELPGSRFSGIDVAEAPVAKGRETVARLGLENIELRPLDVMEVTPEFGEFDYIIAHGLYSWVPAPVQEKVLEIAKANLAPRGVAFVSYNAYPGGHLKNMLREMLLLHVRNCREPAERIRQARALLRFLGEAQEGQEPRHALLKAECEALLARGDGGIYHDELGGVNEPLYFSEFAGRAARHGLQYLAEAEFHQMQETKFPARVVEELRRIAGDDRIAKEQYLDFLKCRKFRQTLLCHEQVPLEKQPDRAAVMSLYAACAARPTVERPDIDSDAVVRFETPQGAGMETRHPLAKAAIWGLGQVWPQCVRFNDLLGAIRSRRRSVPQQPEGEEAEALAEILLGTFAVGLTELHAHEFRFVPAPGERPVASPLARLQAGQNEPVTTLRHTTLRIGDEVARRLLLLLDGTRDRAALLQAVAALPGITEPPEALTAKLEESLDHLARLALLVA